MKHLVSVVLAACALGGCAAQPPVFSWYHPMGGEYLFAYDKNECETEVLAAKLAMGSDPEGPFFQCMHQRGYYLVDERGAVLTPPAPMAAQRQASATR